MKTPIYLDHHATTPLDPRVLEGMLPFLREHFGNAASRNHVFGRNAAAAVEEARERVAQAIGARYAEIVFTAGATEANALALLGLAEGEAPGHLVTSAIEHPSVLDNARRLGRAGWSITVLPVDRHGRVGPEDVRAALTPHTRLVSVMAANNEIGTLQPLAAIGAVVRGSAALFHVDATQALGRVPIDVEALGIDLLSLSAHKAYGPKGVGALYRRRRPRRVMLGPLFEGGGQEDGLRPGTQNVPGIVGMGLACELAVSEMPTERPRLLALRRRLQARLVRELDGLALNGHPEERLAGSLHLSIAGVEPDALLLGLQDVAVSAGSACSTGAVKPSYVLQAIAAADTTGAAQAQQVAALRLCVGRFNTEDEIDRAAQRIVERVRVLRQAA
ncbi:MAG: cysteine desulfurase [Burkholderiales bacterium]|nr:cysteine desulfurase [Burkholderiales bacterium]